MASACLRAVTCFLLICSLDAVVQTPFGPRTLAQHVQHYLDNGGHRKYQKAFGLGPNVYFNPLVFLEREDIHPSQSKSKDYASDLQILRALSLPVPGVDPLDKVVKDRQLGPSGVTSSGKIVAGEESRFAITYSANTPPNVRSVVESAVKKWADKFQSVVTIRISFTWSSDLSDSTLGAATSPTSVNGGGSANGASFTPSLASAIGERDVTPNSFHVAMVLNERVRWHFDVGRRAPFDRFDLATTVLHELTHGLFFSGMITGDMQSRRANFLRDRPGRFDQFMRVEGNIPVARVCARNQTNLFNAITNPTLRFVDQESRANFALFSPGEFQEGSSVYHFDNVTLSSDCQSGGIETSQCSDLMTHQLNVGYTQQEIGETTSRVLMAMRSSAVGVLGNASCDLPDSPLTSGTETLDTAFTLPTWGIAAVAGVAGVGVITVAGVVFASIAARKRGGTG